MNAKLARRAALSLAAAGGLFYLNCRRDARWMSVRYAWQPVTRHTFAQTVHSPGTVEAATVVTLRAEVGELIVKKYAQQGDRVKAGDVLLELGQDNTRLAHDRAKNSFMLAQDGLARAKKELVVQKKLFRSQAVAYKNVEEADLSLKKARGDFEIARQELALAEGKLGKTTVRSPIAGVVLKDNLIGANAVSADQELFQVGDDSRFVVRAKVDELNIQKVREGQKALIEVDAYPEKMMEGKVKSVAAEAERQNFGEVTVLIELTQANGIPLKHNLSVQAHLVIEEIPDTLALPLAALKKGGDGDRVIIRGQRGGIRWRRVRLGRISSREVEVVSGIEPGEEVGILVSDGRASL